MSLFQNSVLQKYLKGLDQAKVDEAWQRFTTHFHDAVIQENIRNSKEEQYQEGFLRDLFVKIFGYVLNPATDFNLTTELKNVKGAKKTDGAILQNGNALAVIELKGMNTTDLGKVEGQAFGYKNNQPDCVYVITSNFQKIRFYIDNAVDFEEFNLFQLNRAQFEILYLCVAAEYLLLNTAKQIKDESLTEEENVTKQLYKDYSLFRNEIFQSIQQNNPDYDKLTLFKKTQKLLDRFLFIFFAEDRGLLPPNSIREIIDQWVKLRDELDAYTPLYARFKKYFGYMNTGHQGVKHDIFAYNGGLFAPDEILDHIKIDDTLLYKHTQKLSGYDFETEVSVNILGHIFEHSLNEIEEIQNELEGIPTDKSNSKRKKDGVFYTPKYITKYIVNNTVGKLCEEKKTELDLQETEYEKERKGRKKATLKALVKKLEDYRKWLLEITICDPACGSGAFLNQSLEFLISEHRYIDELQAKLFGDAMVLSDIENSILENNLFGVDINEESVEIAKLSLWLRTAQKGRKLTSLNNNIKCGNSLIDDVEVAGDKAFKWEEEFPKIFKNGGFDVVIGNPPYGAVFTKKEIEYYNKNYPNQSYQLDSYLLFTEKTRDFIASNGFIGYIMPNTWLSTLLTDKIRKFVFNTYSVIEINHYSYFVFDDATVETDIYILRRENENNKDIVIKIIDAVNTITKKINQEEWIKKDGKPINIYESNEIKPIKIKLEIHPKLGELIQIVQGVKPFQKGKGKPPQDAETMRIKPFVQEKKIDDSFIPLLRGSLMNRYQKLWDNNYWISYGDWLAEPRYSAKFECNEKLIIRQTGDSLIACFDDEKFICRDNLYILRDDQNKFNLKYILAILNSKLLTWYFRNFLNPEKGKTMAQVKRGHLQVLPISLGTKEMQVKLQESVNYLIDRYELVISKQKKFLRTLSRKFEIENLSTKLQNWHTLTFTEFIKELQKKKVKLGLAEEAEWEEYFDAEKAKAQAIQLEIDKTDREIDAMVYELYGLTEEEIAIVEGS